MTTALDDIIFTYFLWVKIVKIHTNVFISDHTFFTIMFSVNNRGQFEHIFATSVVKLCLLSNCGRRSVTTQKQLRSYCCSASISF